MPLSQLLSDTHGTAPPPPTTDYIAIVEFSKVINYLLLLKFARHWRTACRLNCDCRENVIRLHLFASQNKWCKYISGCVCLLRSDFPFVGMYKWYISYYCSHLFEMRHIFHHSPLCHSIAQPIFSNFHKNMMWKRLSVIFPTAANRFSPHSVSRCDVVAIDIVDDKANAVTRHLWITSCTHNSTRIIYDPLSVSSPMHSARV